MTETHTRFMIFSDTQKGTKEGVIEEIDIDDERLDGYRRSGTERTAHG